MNSELLAIPVTCIQIAVLLYIIIRAVPLTGAGARSMAVVFFLFAAVSLLISYVYWIAYDLIRPDVRMPFAANEIGEGAGFLLLGSALNAVFRPDPRAALRETILTALFACACTALWIGWTGEWADDILSGVCVGYLLCSSVRAIKLSGAFSRSQWLCLGIGAAILIAAQTATFFIPEPLRSAVDLGCYALMLLGIVLFFVITIRALVAGTDSRKTLSLSFGCFGWTLSALYMSAGIFYVIIDASLAAALILLLPAMRREALQP